MKKLPVLLMVVCLALICTAFASTELSVGQMLYVSDIRFTVEVFESTDKVRPCESALFYTPVGAPSGMTYLHVAGTVENLTDRALTLTDIVYAPQDTTALIEYNGNFTDSLPAGEKGYLHICKAYATGTEVTFASVSFVGAGAVRLTGNTAGVFATARPSATPTAVPTAIPTAAPTMPAIQPVSVYTDTETCREVQRALNSAGYDCGTPDGVMGSRSNSALSAYRAANGMSATAVIDDELLSCLGVTPAAAPSSVSYPQVCCPGVSADRITSYSGGYTVTASSHYTNRSSTVSVAEGCAADGNLDTAWNTNSRWDGEWISFTARDGKPYVISGFTIANGYWKSSAVYRENPRVRVLDVYCGDTFVQSFTLNDSRGTMQRCTFDKPVTGNGLRFVIRDVYAGTQYRDCAITEISLF